MLPSGDEPGAAARSFFVVAGVRTVVSTAVRDDNAGEVSHGGTGCRESLLDVLHLLAEIWLQAAWMLALQDANGRLVHADG